MAGQSWRDKLQTASFRGIPFKVESTSGDIGRRVVVHEYPQRDLPYTEDLGRKAREFSLEAFVIGTDYMTARDRLVNAIETVGAGELVHPYRGRSQVVVTSCRVSESTADGGMAKFSLSFTEAGVPVNPKPRTDTKAVVKKAALKAKAAKQSWFAQEFSVVKAKASVVTAAIAKANAVLNTLRLAANSVLSGALLPDFVHDLFSMAASVSSLILFPVNLAQGFMGMVTGLSGIANSPLAALSALRSLFGFGSDDVVVAPLTPGGVQQAANQAALSSLIRTTAIIEACVVATEITPASYNEAIALRDELTAVLEAEAETATDDVYRALMELRLAVIADITLRAADLSRLVSVTVPVTLPALVVAYNLYGTVAKADSLVARNHIRHPGFVPGGQALEVLTP